MDYIYEDHYRGKIRQLRILENQEKNEFRVFNGAEFLGSIQWVEAGSDGILWKTAYNMLKPIVKEIGKYLEAHE